MGGRGSSGSTVRNENKSKDYREAFEYASGRDFNSSWFLQDGVTHRMIADNMYSYRVTMGESMIQEAKRDLSAARAELRDYLMEYAGKLFMVL